MNLLHPFLAKSTAPMPLWKPAILLLSRSEGLGRDLRENVDGGYELIRCDTLAALRRQRECTPHRAVLIDLTPGMLGRYSAIELQATLTDAMETSPVYALVGNDCPVDLLKVAKENADMCLDMPLDFRRLNATMRNGFDQRAELQQLRVRYPHKILHGRRHGLITFTRHMFDVLARTKAAARTDSTVVLTGEAGAGKSYLTRIIHERSTRAERPFVTLACTDKPRGVIENEMYDLLRDMFEPEGENAEDSSIARLGGTICLKNIDHLSPRRQVKLLQIVENYCANHRSDQRRFGPTVRLILTSKKNLQDEVVAQVTRMHSYLKPAMVRLHVPPLRERPRDIEYLARRFAVDFSRTYHIPLENIDAKFFRALRGYYWPENIRQLKQVVQRAVLYSYGGNLSVQNIPRQVQYTTATVDHPEQQTSIPEPVVQELAANETAAREEAVPEKPKLATPVTAPTGDVEIEYDDTVVSQATDESDQTEIEEPRLEPVRSEPELVANNVHAQVCCGSGYGTNDAGPIDVAVPEMLVSSVDIETPALPRIEHDPELTLHNQIQQAERRIIEDALQRHHHCYLTAAEQLMISHEELLEKMARYKMVQDSTLQLWGHVT